MRVMRVLVTGSRDWWQFITVDDALNQVAALHGGGENMVITHGACPTGADALATQWALRHTAALSAIPAKWQKYGYRAGPLRNQEMVRIGHDICLAFIGPCTSRTCTRTDAHDSHGASGCADLAEAAGIPTLRYRPGHAVPVVPRLVPAGERSEWDHGV